MTKLKYYYAFYSHSNSFKHGTGAITFYSKNGDFSLKDLKAEIEKGHDPGTQIVIANWQEITKKQFESGIK